MAVGRARGGRAGGRDEASRKRRRQQVACRPLPSSPHSNGETDGILSSVPIIHQPVGHGRHYSPRPHGQQLPGRRTDAWTGQSVSPIADFFTAASTGDPGHLDVLRARRNAPYTNGFPGRARAGVRATRSETTTSSTRLIGSPLPYLPSRPAIPLLSCPVLSCPFQDPAGRAGSLVTC